MEQIEFLSAVLITSKNHETLAQFYKDIICIPLKEEQHSNTIKHYGCELGDIHFAIHPIENFSDKASTGSSIKLAFSIFDLKAFVQNVESKGYKFEYSVKDVGFCKMTALYDPDGNYIEFTELSKGWIHHLEKRKSTGFDIITKWKNFLLQKKEKQ